MDSPLQICARILLRIENCLGSAIPREQIKPSTLTRRRSRSAAAGCEELPDATSSESPPPPVLPKLAKEKATEGAAMKCRSPLGAEMCELSITEESIQTARPTPPASVIEEKTCPPTGKDRTSSLFAIHDRPGSLVRALQAFDQFHVNMSKIESRPAKRKDWAITPWTSPATARTGRSAAACEGLESTCCSMGKSCSAPIRMWGSRSSKVSRRKASQVAPSSTIRGLTALPVGLGKDASEPAGSCSRPRSPLPKEGTGEWPIFISYRRSSLTSEIAKWLKEQLEDQPIQALNEQWFSLNVFVGCTRTGATETSKYS